MTAWIWRFDRGEQDDFLIEHAVFYKDKHGLIDIVGNITPVIENSVGVTVINYGALCNPSLHYPYQSRDSKLVGRHIT